MSPSSFTPSAESGSPESGRAAVNGLQLAYEAFGDPSDPTILLIMGLGTQMIAWPDDFCRTLSSGGYYVVRFDNRDVGLSTYLPGTAPSLAKIALRREALPYTVADMASDALGLLEALGVPSAHIVGVSLGGFIAQTMALAAPDRVRTLTLMMTSTGSRRVGRPKPKVIGKLLRKRDSPDRETAIQATITVLNEISSPGYPNDNAVLRDLIERSLDRGFSPDGRMRQLAAATFQPNRTKELSQLRKPTLVMHGLADPLIGVSGGLSLASSIPGAKFVGFSGMGHDFPRPLLPRYAEEILELSNNEEARPKTTVGVMAR